MSETSSDGARRLAEDARDRVNFEEEALGACRSGLPRGSRRSRSKEEAEDLMQRPTRGRSAGGSRARPGRTCARWLLRILTNLNIDRGRRAQRTPDQQPLEESDYFLYNRLERRPARQTRRTARAALAGPRCRGAVGEPTTFATWSCSSTSASSATPTRLRSSTFRSALSCPGFIVGGVS